MTKNLFPDINNISQILPKPKFGQSCNSCGMCCIVEPCKISKEILGDLPGPCRALESDGDKRVCGLIKRPAWYIFKENVHDDMTDYLSTIYSMALGIEMGCDSDDLDE